MPVLDVERLKGACTQVFEGAGLGADEARQIAHSLVLSNLMGHDSHGVIRLVQYVQALEEGARTRGAGDRGCARGRCFGGCRWRLGVWTNGLSSGYSVGNGEGKTAVGCRGRAFQ